LFLIDNERFIGDFSVMRLLLNTAALLAFAAGLSAADQGRELIRDIITEKDLDMAVIANVANPEVKAGLRKDFLAKAPDSPKAVDAFVGSLDLVVHAELVQDGHRIAMGAVIGNINSRSQAFLLARGIPAPLIEGTAAVTSIKADGQELQGDALDAVAAEIAKKPEQPKPKAELTEEESGLINLAFDKDIDVVVIVGRKSKEWGKMIEKLAAGQANVRARLEATKASLQHLVALGVKKDGHSVSFLLALGEMNEKVRATLLASGIPEGLIDTKAALIGVSVDNVQLKGDKLDEFAEAFKAARDKKTPPPALKSLADLSK
jgi:predicted kinase